MIEIEKAAARKCCGLFVQIECMRHAISDAASTFFNPAAGMDLPARSFIKLVGPSMPRNCLSSKLDSVFKLL
ncbi:MULTISPECIES: hypothetical protein [unclassified Rhizobium]|uniref:hypothetical protein n=1 Tax=unclassified Rhizobium TaxID=2613769 RepID=UPI000EA9AF46|nr:MULTISPECIES: hypothetical protein [unclassified Rhizobium]AYG64760.1 hypothetical protein CCGE531_01215 [Rhizobium sp. CCGE531]AYG71244.1 hypothetical protein CCGE532_01215 [Rhizobium sp. CCGE532]